MPVLLTTPFDPGDLDPGHTYPRATITLQQIRPELEQIIISFEFGSVVNGAWVKGSASPEKMVVVNAGTDYDALVSEVATEDDDYKVYTAAKRVLYEYLIDKGHLVGTIE